MNKESSIAIKICGPAGTGIMQLGDILCGAFNKAGLYCLVYPEYESRIRGGDNNLQIVISSEPNPVPRQKVNLLFSIGQGLSDKHKGELKKGGLIFESGGIGLDKIPEVKKLPIVLNSAIAGFIWKLFFAEQNIILKEIGSSLSDKIADINVRSAEAGFSYNTQKTCFNLKPVSKAIVCKTGNEAIAEASLMSDVRYVSIYPMTPITSLLEMLSKSHVTLVQPEDEIFAALSCIGASYAGQRSLTATSGGGFCLMNEGVGFSAMAEVPLVIILGQRTGPSSGIATYSSQADLDFAIFSGNGEAQKIVLAPGDLEEAKLLTQQAFNLADQYQVPVLVLTDKYLSESRFSTDKSIYEKIKVRINRGKKFAKSSTDYKRYKNLKDGVSPRALPGEVVFETNSYEHDEAGRSTDDAKMRVMMNEKRFRKLTDLKGGFEVFGKKNSSNLVIGWGSTKTAILEYLNENGNLKFIHISRVWPFPIGLKEELKKAKKIVVVENNSTGQMAKLVRRETGIETKSLLKDDGRPFFKEELAKALGKII